MLKSFFVGLWMSLLGVAGKLLASHKTELFAASVIAVAVLFATGPDRWRVIAAAAVGFLAGRKTEPATL